MKKTFITLVLITITTCLFGQTPTRSQEELDAIENMEINTEVPRYKLIDLTDTEEVTDNYGLSIENYKDYDLYYETFTGRMWLVFITSKTTGKTGTMSLISDKSFVDDGKYIPGRFVINKWYSSNKYVTCCMKDVIDGRLWFLTVYVDTNNGTAKLSSLSPVKYKDGKTTLY